MSDQLMVLVGTILGIPITYFAMWLIGRRKTAADISASIAGASQDAVATMNAVMIELRDQVNSLKHENASLREEINNLHNEIQKLRSRLP